MRMPNRMTVAELFYAERFAAATGIGPLFDQRPRHHGQHSWCCTDCNEFKAKRAEKAKQVRQPWEITPEPNPERYTPRQIDGESHGRRDDSFYRGCTNYIYFVQAAGQPASPIKIGYAMEPHKRLKTLQTAYPYKLEMLHCVPGDRTLEKRLHWVFKHNQSFGEWFAGSAVPVIHLVADRLCERMRQRYEGGKNYPEAPSLDELHAMSAEARALIYTQRKLAA